MRRTISTLLASLLLTGTLAIVAAPPAAATNGRGASCSITRIDANGRTHFLAHNRTRYAGRIFCYVKLKWDNGRIKYVYTWFDVPAFSWRRFWYRWYGNWQWAWVYKVRLWYGD